MNTIFVDDLLNSKQLFCQVAGQEHLRDAAQNCAFDKVTDVDASRAEQVILCWLRPDRWKSQKDSHLQSARSESGLESLQQPHILEKWLVEWAASLRAAAAYEVEWQQRAQCEHERIDNEEERGPQDAIEPSL